MAGLTGRAALVTGVVGGIGRAIARRLAAEGAEVTVTDRPGRDLEAAAAELGLPHIPADLGVRDEVVALVAALPRPPAILVSSAGGVAGQVGRPVEEVPEADWRAIFAANVDSAFFLAPALVPAMKSEGHGRIVTISSVDSAFFLAQALVPAMKSEGHGRIVTISSGAGLKASLTGIQAYAASKHALVGLTRQLAAELGPHGITVNSIAPGFVLSNPASRAQWDSYGAEGQAAILARIHTRRLGRPEDIAAAAAFLCSDDAAWITGQILSVDGGHA